MTEPVLDVRDLGIRIARSGAPVVEDVTFTLAPGEILGLVGESGSGKTTAALALLGHCRDGLAIGVGAIRLAGADVLGATPPALRALRGRRVAYVPQDPTMALNPMLSLRTQLGECLADGADRDGRLKALMGDLRLPGTDAFLSRRPHQLSGGQQQRIGIAMAFANRPDVVVLDEPTTGLDVTTQAQVLDTVRRLCEAHQVAAVYVSHDLSVVGMISHRVAVMYAGRIVESGPAKEVLRRPRHHYTRALIAAAPDIETPRRMHGIPGQVPDPGDRPEGCPFRPRCDAADAACALAPPALMPAPGHVVHCVHPATDGVAATPLPPPVDSVRRPVLDLVGVTASHGKLRILHDVGFAVPQGSCTAIVGESGSGKTTLSRTIAGLHDNWSGDVLLDSKALARSTRQRTQEQRRQVQYIFQNAYSSFNPRRSIGDSLAAALTNFERLTPAQMRDRVAAALDAVLLAPAIAGRRPGALSGGQRQRAAIARALIVGPRVLMCDEITSALDVSVQASIMDLLQSLREDRGMTMVFVTHNLALVRSVADRVVVLEKGRVAESGPQERLFLTPDADETRRLIRDTPRFRVGWTGDAA